MLLRNWAQVLVLLPALWGIQTNISVQTTDRPHDNIDVAEYTGVIKPHEKGSYSQAEESCTKPDLFSKENLRVQEKGSPTPVPPETEDGTLADIVEANASAESNRSRNETVLVLSQQIIIAVTVSGFFGLIIYVIYCAVVRSAADEKGSEQELETLDDDQHRETETVFDDHLRQSNTDKDHASTEIETNTLLQE